VILHALTAASQEIGRLFLGHPLPFLARRAMSGLGCLAQFRYSQHITSTVRIANITTIVHDRQELLRHHSSAAPLAPAEQGDRRMTSGGLDARAR
jgi:hypothetical protein